MSLERFSNIHDFLVTPSSVSNVMPNKWTDTLTAGGALIKYPINFTFLNEILEQTITLGNIDWIKKNLPAILVERVFKNIESYEKRATNILESLKSK